MNLLRLLIFWIIFVFLCFPSNAYDEKIKLNRTDNKIISGETKIKITLNNMLNFRKIEQINKYYASIEYLVKKTSKKIRNKIRLQQTKYGQKKFYKAFRCLSSIPS